jgi:hypothetical protein
MEIISAKLRGIAGTSIILCFILTCLIFRVILVFATPQPPPPPPSPQLQPQYVIAPPPQPQYPTAPQQSQYAIPEQYNVYGSQIHNLPQYAVPLPLSSYVQPQHRNYVWRV